MLVEQRTIPGGKARSVPVPDSGKDGRPDLPGEHGFRFFPGFYKHVPDTMRRIPYKGGSVFDNLVTVDVALGSRMGGPSFLAVAHFPTTLEELKIALKMPDNFEQIGLTRDDMEFFLSRLWRLMTSCQERRYFELERIGWWDFIGASERSKAYQTFLAIGATRNLVAAKAEVANARTVGDIAVQILLDNWTPGTTADRVLNGPTNEVWISPWLDVLSNLGVEMRFGAQVTSIDFDGKRVTGATISAGGMSQRIEADYFVCALPIEVTARLLDPKMIAADPTLRGIPTLAKELSWMNGIQFYLREDVSIVKGHENYLDAPWALTSVSQQQFWPDFDLARFGDGQVRGVLSVDISAWDQPGLNGKKAWDCTPDEIAKEVWAQLKASLNVDGKVLLRDENLHSWFLDPDIQEGRDRAPDAPQLTNTEPLLVNLSGSWMLRPDAYTMIPNFFLAADYVRTFTDFASMEGASEAARRAVNALLGKAHSSAPLAEVWPLHEPDILGPLRLRDQMRWDKGLPWAPVFDLDESLVKRLRDKVAHLFGR